VTPRLQGALGGPGIAGTLSWGDRVSRPHQFSDEIPRVYADTTSEGARAAAHGVGAWGN
jgi:hypothetical protein